MSMLQSLAIVMHFARRLPPCTARKQACADALGLASILLVAPIPEPSPAVIGATIAQALDTLARLPAVLSAEGGAARVKRLRGVFCGDGEAVAA